MVDYSKWKDFDISDAEDDVEPKINSEALFLWHQQAWVERLEELVRGEEDIKEKRKIHEARLVDIKERISAKDGDKVALKKQLEKVEKEGKELDRLEHDMMLKEKKELEVDKICKSFYKKIGINKSAGRKPDEELSLEEFQEFVKENEELCKQYGMLRKYEDSRRFLEEHQQLVCEETCCFLTNWCIDLELEKKHEQVAHVAHQCVCMQYILELGERLGVDPRACVSSFFSRTQLCLPEYLHHFETDVKEFKERVQVVAQEKIQEANAKMQDVHQTRLGPGGLDPHEVYESLPEEVQAGFRTGDRELLMRLFDAMPSDVAHHHHRRCLASGLWLQKNADGAAGKDAAATTTAAAQATAAATTAATADASAAASADATVAAAASAEATTAAATADTAGATAAAATADTTADTADTSAGASADAITASTAAAPAAADDAEEEPIYTGASTEDLD
ncbi:hsp90 co-chaperone Cdc37-like [Drosophila pseudoobscura]|uniref:Hsp90 co-chaperone Cdc37 n=1 Tax=Drosophila pseudoobscura pseudoobscura TaxID=46245 RepID=A0A6I8VYT1_DROPS|nr:hsp90 co-chaperone Cdc37 [Drosophila pseudoobscura]